jgi:hypothetical protein
MNEVISLSKLENADWARDGQMFLLVIELCYFEVTRISDEKFRISKTVAHQLLVPTDFT